MAEQDVSSRTLPAEGPPRSAPDDRAGGATVTPDARQVIDAPVSKLLWTPAAPETKRSAWWLVLGALLLPCVYLLSLGTRFDFTDDGNLVYPSPPMPPGVRLALVWEKIVANYEHLGPFRPVLWAHWETQAELLGASSVRWRAFRLGWSVLAAGALLWLLRELRLRPVAALFTTALAMWNPYRGEVWTSLTLSEGVAMPYALLALVCAVRAGRSSRAWAWDVLGVVCVLAALGCKNTFAALVPAQVLLRLAPDGEPLREAWRRHGRRAVLLALTLLLPLGHFVLFKLTWQPGRYSTEPVTWRRVAEMLRAVAGAMSSDALAAGVFLAVAVLVVNAWRRTHDVPGPLPDQPVPAGLGAVWGRHRAACRAALALLVCGIGIYLPVNAVSGRYSIPAVWGADLLLAVLLSELAEVASNRWRWMAWAVLGCGLLAVLIANVGRQQRLAARAELLWQALEHVERQAPAGACVGWIEGPQLGREEGIHFYWHLHARGRTDLRMRLLDSQGRGVTRRELPPNDEVPWLFVSVGPPPAVAATEVERFGTFYWAGTRQYHLSLWAAD